MRGSTFKRCTCPPQTNARGDRIACKLNHGSWFYVVEAGRNPATGRRRQFRKGGFPTKRDAERALAEAVDGSTNHGLVHARRRQTFAAYASQWMDARKRRVRPGTVIGYESALTHALAAFGATPLADVSRMDVERMITGLADKGRSQRTSQFTLFVVRAIFSSAVQDGLIGRNPAQDVTPVGVPAKTRTAQSSTNISALRAHLAGDPLFACWLLTLYGLRRSEVLALKWTDVDLAAGTLAITRSRVSIGSKAGTVEGKPKTKRGTRTLPLPPDVLTALRELRERQAAEFGFGQVRDGYLCLDELGQPMRPERWSRLWQQHCKAAGIPVVTLHAARHSSVSIMRANGVPDYLVAAWHGHDETVMRAVYSHADAVGLAAAGNTFAQVISDPGAQTVTNGQSG
jgi:integrase